MLSSKRKKILKHRTWWETKTLLLYTVWLWLGNVSRFIFRHGMVGAIKNSFLLTCNQILVPEHARAAAGIGL